MEVQSGSSAVASSSHEDIMFFVYGNISGYEVKAFKRSGEVIQGSCFTIDLGATGLPFDCGFGAVGPTLYMIGGDTFSAAYTPVPNLVTYKVDLNNISRFPNQSLPRNLVQEGPQLRAKKQHPIVIVVKNRIYVFSRCLFCSEKAPNFEYLDTKDEKWITLHQPPFSGLPSDRDFLNLEITSHVVTNQTAIVIWISGEAFNGVFSLDLHTHKWRIVESDCKSHLFYGKGVCFDNVYHAYRYPCDNNPENLVCCFRIPLSSKVEQVKVSDIQKFPEKVRWLQQSEIGIMGDSLFIARAGYDSRPDPEGEAPAHYLTVQKLQVPMVVGAIKSHEIDFELKGVDDEYRSKSLYFVSWVKEERKKQRKKERKWEKKIKKVGGK